MRFRRVQHPGEFARDPVRACITIGASLVWCMAPGVGGSMLLRGKQTPEETREVLRLFEIYRGLSAPLRLIFDGRATADGVDQASVMLFLEWIRAERETLEPKLELLIGVIPEGLTGIMLSGLMPAAGVGEVTHIAVTTQISEAFALLGAGDLQRAVEEEMEAAQREPAVVRALHALLRHRGRPLTVDEAARQLGRSPRGLQRELTQSGTTFRREQDAACFALVTAMLSSGEAKIAAIAAELGMSEHRLALIVRRGSGLSIAEYRQRLQLR